MVDSAAGVFSEARNQEIAESCENTVAFPLLTLWIKLDRDGREPPISLQELEEVLGIASYPMNQWLNEAFEGLYDLYNQRLNSTKGWTLASLPKDGDKLFLPTTHSMKAKRYIWTCKQLENDFSEEGISAGH